MKTAPQGVQYLKVFPVLFSSPAKLAPATHGINRKNITTAAQEFKLRGKY